MKINTKKLIMASLALIAAGAVLMGVGYLFGGRAGVAFSREGVISPYGDQDAYMMKKTKIDPFSDAEIKIESYADIRIRPSGDDHFYAEYKLDGYYSEPVCQVRDDMLVVTHTGKPRQYGMMVNYFSFGVQNELQNAGLTLYIPKGEEMGRLDVRNDSGDLSIEGIAFEDGKLKVSYGGTELRNVSFQDLELSMESGNLDMEDVTAENLVLKNEYGNVTMKKTSFQKAEAELESGRLRADDFTCGTLSAQVDYGDIDLDDASLETAEFVLETGNLDLNAGKLTDMTCKNDYGNVNIRLPEDVSEYSINARSEYGSINLPDSASGHWFTEDDESVYVSKGKTKGTITVKVESGDIDIR